MSEREQLPPEEFEKYFSCFSAHMLQWKGVLYTTTEHAYHAMRYRDAAIQNEIRLARSARAAWAISQKYKAKQIPDWDSRKRDVMEELFRAKLAQHADVREALEASGDVYIVKQQATDPYWGTGPDGLGRNEMGKIWMKLREEYRHA